MELQPRYPFHDFGSREFCNEVGPASKVPRSTHPAQEQQPPIQTGSLIGHDWHIIWQLANQGEGATFETICTEVTTALAKRSLDPNFVERRLTHLEENGLCSQEPLPDGSTSWRLTKVGLATAQQFPASK